MNVTQKFINVPEEYSEYSEYYNDDYKKIVRRLVLRSNKLPLNDIDMNIKIDSILEKPMFYEEIETLITDINWYEKELEYSVEHLLYFIKCRIDKDNYQRELDERKQKSDKLYYNVLKQREKKESERDHTNIQYKLEKMRRDHLYEEHKRNEEKKLLEKRTKYVRGKISDEMITYYMMNTKAPKSKAINKLMKFMMKYFDRLSLMSSLSEIVKSETDYETSNINPYYNRMKELDITWDDINFYSKYIDTVMVRPKIEDSIDGMPISIRDHGKNSSDGTYLLKCRKL